MIALLADSVYHPAMSLPVVRERSKGVWVATWSNVCISLVRDQLSIADVRMVRRVYETLAAEQPAGFVAIIVAPQGVGMPADDARQAITDVMKGLEHRIAAMAGILEASGFKAAALRTAMATMALLSRATYPRKIFASIDEAVPFVGAYVTPVPTHAQVRNAIAHVKALGTDSYAVQSGV
jgi:hypothetical protein